MKFNDLIVGRRGASSIVSARGSGSSGPSAESPGACSPKNIADGFANSSLPTPIQDGQFFIAQNGGVYARNFKDGDQEILLPAHVAAKDTTKLADTRSRREALTCLKLLIQMRDLKSVITAGAVHPSLLEEMRADLLGKYKGFVQAFGPLNSKIKPAPSADGWVNPYYSSSRVKAFKDSPDGAYIADLEIYDPATGRAEPAAILGAIAIPVSMAVEAEEDDRLRPGPARMERREMELEFGI